MFKKILNLLCEFDILKIADRLRNSNETAHKKCTIYANVLPMEDLRW